MDINAGNGLYNKYGMIDSVIVSLDTIPVTGVDNMIKVIDAVKKLAALKDGLRNEDKQHEQDHIGQEGIPG